MKITEERFVKALEMAMRSSYRLDSSKSIKKTLIEMERLNNSKIRPDRAELENENTIEKRLINLINETDRMFSYMLDEIDTIGLMIRFLEQEKAENESTERLMIRYGYYC